MKIIFSMWKKQNCRRQRKKTNLTLNFLNVSIENKEMGLKAGPVRHQCHLPTPLPFSLSYLQQRADRNLSLSVSSSLSVFLVDKENRWPRVKFSVYPQDLLCFFLNFWLITTAFWSLACNTERVLLDHSQNHGDLLECSD